MEHPSLTATTQHIVIYGILGDEPYRSKHRYTPEQVAEIRDITVKTAHAVVDELAPGQRKEWPDMLVTDSTDV